MQNKLEKLSKNKIIWFAKFVVTAIILFFILKKINISRLLQDFQTISFSTISIIIFTTLIKLTIQYSNWKKYLHLNREYQPKRLEILKSFFIGMSLHFLLPAGIGLFGKMYFVNNKKIATTFSVGVERIFVTWKNVFFASFAAIFYFQSLNIIIKILIFIIVLFSPFFVYLFSYLIKKETIRNYLKNYLTIVPVIIFFQVIFALISIYQYYIVLNNFIKISFWKVLISVPLVHISHIIPISFSGFGLREVFAIEIFSKFGVSPEVAVSTTLIIFLINTVVPAFVGLYFLIRSKK